MSHLKEMSFSPSLSYGQETIKATLISIVPFPIREFKPGLCPGQYELPPCLDGIPVCLVIDQAHHFVYIDAERGSMRVIDPSYDVADAIVRDYNSAQIEAAPGAHPGFFWLLGEWDVLKMQKDPRVMAQLDEIRLIQKRWFINLIKLADDDWERTRQHAAISDVQRFAAKDIDPDNSRGRVWIFVAPEEQLKEVDSNSRPCPACYSDVANDAVICRYCTFILDQKRFDTMSFASSGGAADIAKRAMQKVQ